MHILLEIGSIIVISLGLLAIFSLFEALSRKYKWNPDEMRRISHVVGALFGVGVAITLSKIVFIIATTSFAVLMAISHRKSIFRHIHGVSRKTYGEELLPLGLLSAYLICNADPRIFVPAFLITGISDPINGFVVNKTNSRLPGFLCFVASAALLLLIFTPLNSFIILGTALIVGIVEQIFTYGTDNLMVPVAVAVVLLLML